MADNLDFLKKLSQVKIMPNSLGSVPKDDFLFKLYSVDGHLMLQTVNAKGKLVTPDPADYPGIIGNTLVNIEVLTQGNFDVWNVTAENTGITDITGQPLLIYQLIKCPNLVNNKLQKIKFIGDAAITLKITEIEGDDNQLQGKIVLSPANSDDQIEDFIMLSEIHALSGQDLYTIAPIGDNYSSLAIFDAKFDKDSIEGYLAIFLTYFSNIKIDYQGRRTVMGDTVDCVPTIIFEKVENDRSLYLRLGESRPDDKQQDVVLESVPTNCLVSLANSGRIVVHKLNTIDLGDYEFKLRKIIEGYAPSRQARAEIYYDNGLFIVPAETASNFLLEGLPKLLSEYRVAGIDNLKEYKLTPVRPKLNVRFSSGIDFLEGSAQVDLGSETLTLAELLRQYRKNSYIKLKDGTRAIIDRNYIDRIERIFRKPDENGNFKISFFDLPEVEAVLQGAIEDTKALKRPREFYAGFNDLAKKKLRLPEIKAELRPYQADGVKWLKYLYDNNLGGCLADDMGLGKTLQIISLVSLALKDAEKPSLIVMPRSLLFNWESEFRKFMPEADFCVYYGNNRNLAKALKHKIILTTYAIVRNEVEDLSKQHFDTIILDESQTIKNVSALQTRSVYMLKADHRFAMSGTPIENNLSELYSLFRFLNPAMFGSLEDFTKRYITPIQKQDDSEAVESLRRKIFPFMLRRIKKDVLKDLPDRIDQTLYVDMDAEQARFYEDRRRFYLEKIEKTLAVDGLQKSQVVMFQAMSELRRIASVPESMSEGKVSSPKLELLIEQISAAVDNGHKVVVFFNFIAGLELLAERLRSGGIESETMTGATANRAAVVRRFQSDPECPVLIMTLKTGGVGLNLTAADMVFIAEPWWNKAAEEQAINRLYRIGQKATVFSFSVITRDTIEEKIRQLQQQKADLFNEVIMSDESTSKKLSEDDIKFILS